MSYTFIKNNNDDGYSPNPFLAISHKIETLKVSETYDSYGQKVGHYFAGDYHFNNSSSSSIADCNNALLEAGLLKNNSEIQYNLSDLDSIKVEDLYGENEGCDKEEIKIFVEDWRENNESYTECKGFDYWDGHNWKTIVTSTDFGESDYEIIEENTEAMNKAIEESKFIEEIHGKKYFESEDYWVIESAWQGDFEDYQLFDKSTYNLEDLKGGKY